MTYILLILAGALGCNGIPHTVAGLQGRLFPTPFATPPGVGDSPPLVNFAWGSANLILGLVLGARRMPLAAPAPGILAGVAGFVATGAYLSRHFGRVRRTAVAGRRQAVRRQEPSAPPTAPVDP